MLAESSHSSTSCSADEDDAPGPSTSPLDGYYISVKHEDESSDGQAMDDLKTIDETDPYSCPKCQEIFIDDSALTLHMSLKHPEYRSPSVKLSKDKQNASDCKKQPFTCNVCGKEFPLRYTFIRHLEGHKNGQYFCKICGKGMKEKAYLTRHMKTHDEVRPFSCSICPKTFITKSYMIAHIKCHTESYPCDKCNKKFPSQYRLTRHMKVHTDEKHFCEICGQAVKDKAYLAKHVLRHKDDDDRPHKCTKCGRGFIQASHLSRHLKLVNCSLDPQLKCEICGVQFELTRSMKLHMASHKKEQERLISLEEKEKKQMENSDSERADLNEMETGLNLGETCGSFDNLGLNKHTVTAYWNVLVKPFSCKICGSSFKTKSRLREHIDTHNTTKLFNCEVCHKSFKSEKALRDHSVRHTDKYACLDCGLKCSSGSNLRDHVTRVHAEGRQRFHCTICEKVFATDSYLQKHVKMHNNEFDCVCHVCGKGFSQKINLKIHMRMHSQERPYSCDLCDRTFKYHANWTIHMRNHRGEKPYGCDLCDASFASMNRLNRHRRTHGTDKNILCQFCKKGYSDKGGLRQHVLASHPECLSLLEESDLKIQEQKVQKSDEQDGPVKVNCDQCDKTFKCPSGLRRHMTVHSSERPFQCIICSKSSKTKDDLLRHMKTTHSNERPHVCESCGKSFKEKGILKRHMLLHSGEKPHSCALCNETFTHRPSLVNHLKKVHSASKEQGAQDVN